MRPLIRRLLLASAILTIVVPVYAATPGHADKGGSARQDKGARTVAETPANLPDIQVATDFDCNKPANSMEAMVCQDDGLSRLDIRLEKVFSQAIDMAEQAHPPSTSKLITEQKHWVKGLKECMKNEDPHMCLGDTFILRITQLQAAWGLAPALTPLKYLCDNNPARVVIATFYRTKPATAKLDYNNVLAIVHQVPSATVAHYQGQNVELWLKGKEASIDWKGTTLTCISQPGS